MGDKLEDIMARYEAATTCGNCCDDDFCAYVDTKHPEAAKPVPVPASAARRRKSVRYLNENPAG